MRLLIKTTNLSLSPALRQYIERKIGELDRFLLRVEPHDDEALSGKRDPIEVRVEIGKPSKHHRHGKVYYAEVNIDLPGRVLRAESNQWDIHTAIDEVKHELRRELKQYVDKQCTRSRAGARAAKTKLKTIE